MEFKKNDIVNINDINDINDINNIRGNIGSFYESLSHAGNINEDNLLKILHDNQNTSFGQKYDFKNIHSIDEYQKKVPVTDYSYYEELSDNLQAFTAYQVRNILMTSGTMGRRKRFCLTEESLKRYGGYIYQMPYVLSGSSEGPHLHTSVFRTASREKAILSSAYFSYLADNGYMDCEQFTGGRKLMFSDNISDVAYVKAWLALSCSELRSIQSIFLYDVLLVLQFICENYKIILNDMRNHTVTAKLDDEIKKMLLEYVPDSERLDEIDSIMKEGTAEPIVPKLWKNICFISGIGGEIFRVSTDALRIYTGDVPVYYFSYSSSECMMGVSGSFNSPEYILMPQSCVYEFMAEDGRVLTADKLTVAETYEPVITTFSGLYRYRMGDIVKVTGYEQEAPVVRIMGRNGNMLNIAGEKLDEGTLQMAVAEVGKKLNINIYDCSIGECVDTLPASYRVFIETDNNTGNKKMESLISECFDASLCELSEDYDDIRNLKMLGRPQTVLLGKGAISGILGSQEAHNKPHVILGIKQSELMQNTLREEGRL